MKQLLGLGIIIFVVSVLTVGSASAGGWAVTTLDSVPRAIANETVDIGFTIRQHGVTTVNPDGEVGIAFRSKGGQEHFFAAAPVGETGHYVAEVTFPDEGTWTWMVRQGWFSEQVLGPIDIAPAEGLTAAEGYRWPRWIRFGLPTLALLFGAGAIHDSGRVRRRRALAA